MAKPTVQSKLVELSEKIVDLEWEVHQLKVKRDELILKGVDFGIPKTTLAEWSGIRRESVYYAVLRADNRRKWEDEH